jgi:hypothetical protein
MALQLDPNSGMPLDPATMQALQEQNLMHEVAATGGTALERQNNATLGRAANTLFPSLAMRQSQQMDAAMKAQNLVQQDGESTIDFSIRQLAAQQKAARDIDPVAAAQMNMQLVKLTNQQAEQAHLKAETTRLGLENDAATQQAAVRKAEGTNYYLVGPDNKLIGRYNLDTGSPESADFLQAKQQNPKARSMDEKTYNQWQDTLEQNKAKYAEVAENKRQADLAQVATISPETYDMAFRQYQATGKMDFTGLSRVPAVVMALRNSVAQRAAKENLSVDQAIANGQITATQGSTYKNYASGIDHRNVVALNTTFDHADLLRQWAAADARHDVNAVQDLQARWATATGQPAYTSLAAAVQLYAGEVGKTLAATGGSVEERNQTITNYGQARSNPQITDALDKTQRMLAGKLDEHRRAFYAGTNGKLGSFDKFVTPGAAAYMPPDTYGQQPAAPPPATTRAAPPPAANAPKTLTYDPTTGSFK